MKKGNKERYIIITTIVVLLALVGIQVSWILNATRLEEQDFNHRVVMALHGAKEGISKRTKTCFSMQDYLCGKSCPHSEKVNNTAQLDSIIRTNLNDFGIELDFEFEIIDSYPKRNNRLFSPKCYLKSLNGLLKQNGIQLRLYFPERNNFMMARTSGIFLISVILIICLVFLFFTILKLLRKEKELSVRLTDFVNNMVHEFQTPLSNIGLATNLIRKKKKANKLEKFEEYTGIIITEKEKMQRNVEEILKIASAEQPEISDNEPIDLHKIIDKVVQRFQQQITTREGQLNLDLKASNSQFEGHRDHIANVFSNLMDNALKYNANSPEIRIKTWNKDNRIFIEIADNGIGISSKELPFIFDKYYRVSTGDIHTTKGFGLGLTYVKHIVDQHDGAIEVKSAINKGTTFTVSFFTGIG